MPPLSLKGNTLGEKHRHFNHLLNEVLKNETPLDSVGSEFGESVVAQLLKIEVANRRRDVEYVVETLKSADMIVVSRAIRGSGWLVGDEQYSHIVEPHFLHDQLLPHLTTRAACKFMLHVRLTLKDERRVESFFKYYEDKDLDKALKWLPNCSVAVIEEAAVKHKKSIKPPLLKRLCRKCSSALYRISERCNTYMSCYFDAVNYLLNTETNKYLDTLERIECYNWPKLRRKQTRKIMKHSPERILKKFNQYGKHVNWITVAKYIEPTEALTFLSNLKEIKGIDGAWLINYDKINPFVKRLPIDYRYKFIKENFFDKNELTKNILDPQKFEWYRHFPFNIAFNELNNLIKTMPLPGQRGLMHTTMIAAAGRDMTNIQTILQHYHDNYINEAFHIKKRFVDSVLLHTNTHRYDDKTWKILDELFYSLEVYMESDKDVQNCLHAIMVYKVLHNEPVPEIVEKKFNFMTLKKYKTKFAQDEKEHVFKYLFTKIESTLISQTGFDDGLITSLSNVMDLLIDWDKDLLNYPSILNKIKELFQSINEIPKKTSIENIYNKKKSWRKYMFEESLLFSPKGKTYVNVLKHDPTILNRYPAMVEAVRCDDAINLRQFLSKLKIYWSDTLADEWINAYKNNMKNSTGCRARVRGICELFRNQELLSVLEYYVPDTHKIIWSEADVMLLNIRKNFCQLMHRANPQPPPSAVVPYAQGDYLQFALPSLNSIFHNLSLRNTYDQLLKILSGPVSLRKHAIRVAFAKLEPHEIRKLFSHIWKSTDNVTIRWVIFKSTFNAMCHNKSESIMNEFWQLLEMFIETLTCKENPQIYTVLTKAEEVPKSIRAKFCVKSYLFFKTADTNIDCNPENSMTTIIISTSEVMETIDSNFISSVILDFFESRFIKKIVRELLDHYMVYVIATYMLCTENEEEQSRRYNIIMKPLLDHSCLSWGMTCEHERLARTFFDHIIRHLCSLVKEHVYKNKYVVPIKMFINIQNEFESKLEYDENYEIITYMKLIINYMKSYNQIKSEVEISKELCEAGEEGEYRRKDINSMRDERYKLIWKDITPFLVAFYIKLLKADIEKFFPSILMLCTEVIANFHCEYQNQGNTKDFTTVRELLQANDFVPGIILALKLLPVRSHIDKEKEELNAICKMILDNPSKEVKIHYFVKFRENPSIV